MACDRCEYNRSLGSRFCPECGERLEEEERPRKDRSDLEKVLSILGCIIALPLSVLLIFELAVGIAKSGYVIDNLAGYTDTLFLIIPTFVDLFDISGVPLKVYYILLLVIVTVSVILIFSRTYTSLKEGKEIDRTPLFEMTVLFAALYICEIVYALILTSLGIEMDAPAERPVWKWMFDLLQASVWEELITRVLYLGLPVAVISILMRKEGASWRWVLGGSGIDTVSIIFIVFSAVMFGAGHLNSWGSWKFLSTLAFGLITGYLFCRYGLYVTICIHFLTDYLQAECWLFGTTSPFVSAVCILLVSLVAIPFVWVYLKRGVLCVNAQLRSAFRRS